MADSGRGREDAAGRLSLLKGAEALSRKASRSDKAVEEGAVTGTFECL